LSEAVRRRAEHRASIGQMLEKGYLEAFLLDPDKQKILELHFHFESSTSILSVEDPQDEAICAKCRDTAPFWTAFTC
jgi:hypothetical protein